MGTKKADNIYCAIIVIGALMNLLTHLFWDTLFGDNATGAWVYFCGQNVCSVAVWFSLRHFVKRLNFKWMFLFVDFIFNLAITKCITELWLNPRHIQFIEYFGLGAGIVILFFRSYKILFKTPKLVSFILLFFISYGTSAQVTKVDLSRAIYYNHSLVGRPEATREHGQDTSATMNCGTWYLQPYDSVYCYNMFNNYKTGGIVRPDPFYFTIDMMANVVITRIAIYIGAQEVLPTSHTLKVLTGVPYVWADTLHTITDNGSEYSQWHKFTPTVLTARRYVQILINGTFPPVAEIVIFGTVQSTVPTYPSKANIPMSIDSAFGVNITNSMGYEKLTTGTMYAKKFNQVRQFETIWFGVADTTPAEPLINFGKGIDFSNNEIVDTLQKYTNIYIAMVNGLSKRMWPTWRPYTGNLTEQKAIDAVYGTGGDSSAAGYRYFNNIGIHGKRVSVDPYYYAHSAWLHKRFAAAFATRPIPMNIYEFGNEIDLPSLVAAQHLPDEAGAYASAAYDGHENTLTYMGESVGIKNCGYNVRAMYPGMYQYDPDYLKALYFWFRWNRTDTSFAADIINVHSYPTSAVEFGASGVGLIPESDYFDYRAKMLAFKQYCNDRIKPGRVTEAGYDSYPYNGTSYCNPPVSFMNPPNVTGQTIDQTQGNLTARLMLILRSANLPFYQFWLADRDINKRVCGTFGTSGLLNLDTVISNSPTYSKRQSYYYFKTVDTLLKNKVFVSTRTEVNGSDSIMIQTYVSSTNADSVLYVIWSPTAKNASFSYDFTMDRPAASSTIALTFGSETGTVIDRSTSITISINVSEKPVFINSAVYLNSIQLRVGGNHKIIITN